MFTQFQKNLRESESKENIQNITLYNTSLLSSCMYMGIYNMHVHILDIQWLPLKFDPFLCLLVIYQSETH